METGTSGGALAEFAGDGGVAVLIDRAHPFARGESLKDVLRFGEQREDFGAREGQRGGADVEEAVAEGVDAVAVDVGDGAVGADAEVAGDELDADHGAGLEVGGIAHAGFDLGAGGDALARLESERAELGREGVEGGAAESAEGERRGDIDHARRRRRRTGSGRGSGG